MKKFIYRMQGILNIKYKVEEQERTNYSIARARLFAEEEALEKLTVRMNDYREEFRVMVNDSLHVRDILNMREIIETMKHLIADQKQRVKKEEQLVELARQRLQAAMVERKTQEKLREKAFDSYKMEFEAEERKEIDEIVSFQFSEKVKE